MSRATLPPPGNSNSKRASAAASVAVAGLAHAQAQAQGTEEAASSLWGTGAPCGACKFLRRRCVLGCVFAPHFGGGTTSGGGGGGGAGAAQFAAVHKVFGASNVAKMLLRVPVALRRDAASTVCYEAQARIADPVYGCVGTILALQHQVALVQAELSIAQTELLNRRLALATVHPAYSVASPTSQMVNCSALAQVVDFMDTEPKCLPSPLLPSHPQQEEEQERGSPADVFAHNTIPGK